MRPPTAPDSGGPYEPTERLGPELDRARHELTDLEFEFAALADPEVVALDDEHDSEGSTVGYERARVAGLMARARRRIDELEAARRRLEEGSYGRCELCGVEIPEERLAALPSTRVCVVCAAS